MIRITDQDNIHQYDEYGNPITTWDDKKCAWIVNPEYEDEDIDWWGEDNDFPQGVTLKEYEEQHPNWASMPDIEVTWTWSEENYKKQFPDWHRFPLPSFPTSCTRSWGYIDMSEEEAIERLGHYCNFNKHADNVEITYNGKIIHNNKLS